MSIKCPLSGSSQVVLIEKVASQKLAKLYEKSIGYNISSEFNNVSEIGFYHCPESDLKFFHPRITGSESFYEKLQKFNWYYLDDKEEYEYASNHIKPADKVLEIGCGKGVFAEKITAKKYVGLEFSQQAQILAAQRNIKVLNESVEEHSINNAEEYDLVCSFQVLEHVADVRSFIKASIRCLKPGGFLIYSVPRSDCFIASMKKNSILNMPPHHVSWWSSKSMQYISKFFDLKLVDIHYEKLAKIHTRWYVSSVILKAIENAIGYKNKSELLDTSRLYQTMLTTANFGSKLIEKRYLNGKEIPDGHSVTGVYQKQQI